MGGPPSMKNRSKMNEDTFARQDTVSWKNPCDEFVSSADGEKQTVLSLAGDGFSDASSDRFDGVTCENFMKAYVSFRRACVYYFIFYA